MRRRARLIATATLALTPVALTAVALTPAVATAAPAPAQTAHTPQTPRTARSAQTGAARLQGSFRMTGRVTTAFNVRGEHVGQRVARLWTFTSTCPSGPCQTVGLLRTRGKGSDSLTLHQNAPGYYVGNGSFYVPLRCGSRIYGRGELVPFRIVVHVTSAIDQNGVVVAGTINASYLNRQRVNLTPCVALKSHDAATYHGQLT